MKKLNEQARINLERAFAGDGGVMFDLARSIIRVIGTRALPRKAELGLLLQQASVISDVISKEVACKKRCTHCCNMATVMSSDEAAYIGALIGVTPMRVTPGVRPQKDLVAKYVNVPCPFLDKGKGGCTIYGHRPLVCRTMFNASSDETRCDTSTGTHAFPMVNMGFTESAYARLFINNPAPHTLTDIREFFPDGLNTKPDLEMVKVSCGGKTYLAVDMTDKKLLYLSRE